MTATTSTPVIDELATPFDDLESPATVATPSCCCCCCCCIVTVGATAMMAGLTVGNDVDDGAAGSVGDDRRRFLVALAASIPILSTIVGLVLVANVESGEGDGPGVAALLSSLGVGAAIFIGLRVRAGRSAGHAISSTLLALFMIAGAVMLELILVLFTAFTFWLAAPLWWWLVWKQWRRQVTA